MMYIQICFGVLVIVAGACASYPGFLCSANSNETDVFFTCESDCQHQHGSPGGKCGKAAHKDYNCYCDKQDKEIHPESLHCIEDKGRYSELCVVDCQCNHGAKTGVCDFERKSCICTGKDTKNSLCKMKNVADFADFTAAIVPTDSLAWAYLSAFVVKPRSC